MTTSKSQADASARKLLTICLPSYNRGPYIKTQVEFLCNFIHDHRLADEIDVIVANNGSTDNTLELLSALDYNNFCIHTHPEHYPTAEENMFRSFDLCQGEYVWFLGDDDPIHAIDLLYALDMLRTGAHDCLVFNSRSIHGDGSAVLNQPIEMNAEFVDLDIRDFIESIGLLYTFAGISNIFIRTRLLTSQNGLKWLKAAPIYSHVAWFIEGLKGCKVRFCNASIVNYRQNDYSNGHWERMALLLNVPSCFFWSTGLVILLELLVEAGAITHLNIANCYDVSAEGNRYRLIDEIYFTIFRQMAMYAKTLDPREKISAHDQARLFTFLIACDPTYFNLVKLLSEGCRGLFAINSRIDAQLYMERFEGGFHEALAKRAKDGRYKSKLIGNYHGFDVYKFPIQFVGIRKDIEDADAYLKVLDVAADGVNVVTAAKREDIIATALVARQAYDAGAAIRVNRLASTPQPAAVTVANDPAVDQLRQQIVALKSSTSWKITAPLRGVVLFFKRLFGR